MDLITLALNRVDEDYHILANTLSYGTNLLIFDDLLAKLIHFQQRLRFLKFKGTPIVQHQALTVSHISASSSSNGSTSSSNNTKGHNNGGGHG